MMITRNIVTKFATLFLLTTLACIGRKAAGHPQCLDFLPPFFPDEMLDYCEDYRQDSCCSKRNETAIRGEVEALRAQIESTSPDADTCTGFVRNISCARCSPYASHVFDGENTGRPRDAPGLCSSYCERFYRACGGEVAQAVVKDRSGRTFASASEFCDVIKLTDTDYCYPDVVQFEARQAAERQNTGELER